MLLADPPDGNLPAAGDCDRGAEDRLSHKDPFRVVPQRAVTKVGDDHFRFVEPVVDALIVFDAAAPLSEAGERVMIRVCHDRPLKAMTVFFDVRESRVKLKLDGSFR